MSKKYIALDIGGTKLLAALFEDNRITLRVKKKTKSSDANEKLENKIVSLVEEILSKANLTNKDIDAVSAGAAGIIDETKGVILYSPNLPFRNFNIKQVIEEKFKTPFFIGNDVNVGLLGEHKYGAAKDKKNVVGIFVGTGIGGGIIIDGKLYSGNRHAAGEIGHMILNTEGPVCNCGQRGCLEAYASKIAMTRDIRVELQRGRQSILKELMGDDAGVIRSKVLKKAVENLDDLAMQVINRATYYLAAGTGSTINIFAPEAVVLGGGVFEALGDYILPILNKNIKKFCMPEILNGCEIVVSKLQDDAILYGAIALIEEFKK